jgi:hypothetical protein
MGGVGYGVSQGYNTIRSELGYGTGTPPPIDADADFLASRCCATADPTDAATAIIGNAGPIILLLFLHKTLDIYFQ